MRRSLEVSWQFKVAGLFACAALSAAGCSSTGDTAPAESSDSASEDSASTASGSEDSGSAVSALFVVTVDSGTFTEGEGAATLTVTPRGEAVMFADRPERSASRVSVESLVDQWSGFGFDTDPPNAVLAIDSPAADIPVELSGVTLDSGELRFTYTLLDETSSGGLANVVQTPLSGAVPATFGNASLFIDNAAVPAESNGDGLPNPPTQWEELCEQSGGQWGGSGLEYQCTLPGTGTEVNVDAGALDDLCQAYNGQGSYTTSGGNTVVTCTISG